MSIETQRHQNPEIHVDGCRIIPFRYDDKGFYDACELTDSIRGQLDFAEGGLDVLTPSQFSDDGVDTRCIRRGILLPRDGEDGYLALVQSQRTPSCFDIVMQLGDKTTFQRDALTRDGGKVVTLPPGTMIFEINTDSRNGFRKRILQSVSKCNQKITDDLRRVLDATEQLPVQRQAGVGKQTLRAALASLLPGKRP